MVLSLSLEGSNREIWEDKEMGTERKRVPEEEGYPQVGPIFPQFVLLPRGFCHPIEKIVDVCVYVGLVQICMDWEPIPTKEEGVRGWKERDRKRWRNTRLEPITGTPDGSP